MRLNNEQKLFVSLNRLNISTECFQKIPISILCFEINLQWQFVGISSFALPIAQNMNPNEAINLEKIGNKTPNLENHINFYV